MQIRPVLLALALTACASSKGAAPVADGSPPPQVPSSTPTPTPTPTPVPMPTPGLRDASPPPGDPTAPADAGMSPPVAIPDDLPPCTRTVMIADGTALSAALGRAAAGDCLVAADGSYAGLTITFKATKEHPLIVRAASRGKALFTGAVALQGSAWVVIDGFDYMAGVNVVDANHNRITRGKFRMTSGTYVNLTGTSDGNRLDHCDLGGLSGGAEGHFVTPTGFSVNTQIDHNHFHDNAPSGGNGRESIRLGCCGSTYDEHETGNVVEHNLFVNCDGESEMIGMKSSGNTIRYNTIRASQGQISFRAGHKNAVIGNYVLGEGKSGTNGIRMLDADHLVYNNYVEVQGFPLRMQHGDVPGFPPIKRARVLFNTFVVRGAPLELGGTGHSVAPADSVFANNIVIGSGTLISEKGDGIALQGNIAFGNVGVMHPPDQIKVVDPMLMKMGEILRITAASPAVGAAVAGDFGFITDDIDGQPRGKDVGADSPGAGAGRKGPLTPADVGPDSP
jgi:poly(beta-D-mannuronate) lyase